MSAISPVQVSLRAFVDPIREGNLDKIKDLFDKASTDVINRRDQVGRTLLYHAILVYPISAHAQSSRYLEIIQFLFKEGSDIYINDFCDKTPMDRAIARGRHLDIIKCVFNNGLDINIKDPFSAHYRDLSIVKWLVENNAEVDSKSEKCLLTPLHYATSKGWTESVKYLVAKGTNPRMATYDKRTLLHLAANKGNQALMTFLIKIPGQSDINAKNKETPLHIVASACDLPIVKFLVEKGANIFAKNTNRLTSFWKAESYFGCHERIYYQNQRFDDREIFESDSDSEKKAKRIENKERLIDQLDECDQGILVMRYLQEKERDQPSQVKKQRKSKFG